MLELRNISKSFPGVKALQNISVSFNKGEIHAICGENGAGKSTLMKIICGIYQADEGDIFLNGEKTKLNGYEDALNHHIGIVNQEINLISNSSIAENICLDKLKRFSKGGFVNWKKVNEVARKYMDMVELKLDPETPVRHLSAAHKQLIQIAKALSSETQVLMLDEPTSSLTQYESEVLFSIMRKLKEQNKTLIFVSHKIEEVQEICDKITVFRDGRLVGTEDVKNVDKNKIVKMMIGRESLLSYKGRLDAQNHEVALKVSGISSRKYGLENLGFEVRKGEILGFYGLVGSGRTEFVRAVIGVDKKDSGDIEVFGKKADLSSLSKSLNKYRIGYVTENRKEEGLFLDNTITMNICMNSLGNFSIHKGIPLISIKKETQNAQDYKETLEIKTPKLTTNVGSLSGGNQQKVSIAKWLSANCDILFIDEPTVGVDIGAKEYIHDLIWNLAKVEQKAVVLISSDMNEIISLSRRIIVFKDQKMVMELKGEEFFAKPVAEIANTIGEYFI